MNFSEPFIRRPVMTTLVMISILVMGIIAYRQLPVNDLPNVDYPTIAVYTSYSGASAEATANLITKPLEKELNGVQGLKQIRSQTLSGFSSIIMEFQLEHPMSQARQDVQMALNRAALPQDLGGKPYWREENPSDAPMMYLVGASQTLPIVDTYSYLDRYIVQRLSSISGVAQVEIWGAERSIRIKIDPETLAAYQMTLGELKRAISTASPHMAIGKISGDINSISLNLEEQLEGVEEIEELVIREKGGKTLLLRDVATVTEASEARFATLDFHKDGVSKPGVFLAIRKQPGANAAGTLAEVKALLPELIERIPDSIDLDITYDKSVFIESAVYEVQETLALAVLLVVLVIFLSVGSLKETFIPALTIPMSIVIAFLAMWILGYSVNILTLLALTLAIGFVVDDAIVVMENILRYKEEGMSPFEAALEGSKQISFTIVAMTLSLVAVFVPLVFMEGMLGRLFREFSITLAVAVLASGFVALTLTPMLCRWMKLESSHGKGASFRSISEKLNATTLEFYKPMLDWVLKHQTVTLVIGVLSVLLTAALFGMVSVDFLPAEDTGIIQGWMAAEKGSNQDKTKALMEEVALRIKDHPAILHMASATVNTDGSWFSISLKPHHERAPIGQVLQELQERVQDIPGKNTYMNPMPFLDLSVGQSGMGTYQYVLKSFRLEELFDAGEKMKQAMEASPAFTSVNSSVSKQRRQFSVDIRDDVVAQLGISPQEIVETLNLAFSKKKVSKIVSATDETPIYMQLQSQYRKSLESLDQVYIRSPKTKAMVPISDLVVVTEKVVPDSIEHTDLFPSQILHFSLAEGYTLSDALEELKRIAKANLPEGVTGGLAGAGKVVQTYTYSMIWLIFGAVLAMYVVLGILYESFIHPLTILSTLPFALLGAVLTLLLIQQPLSLYGFIGIILLIGIVKKNGIMIVDYTLDHVRHKGMSPEKAVYEACIVRFRPIMMTTSAAALGALPIAIAHGSLIAARSSLGWVIIGGLAFSQLLTLLFTPVLYLQFQKLQERLGHK